MCRRNGFALTRQQYFKSIEQVATSQGFGQFLPSAELTLKKRDSVLAQLDSPKSPTPKSFLMAPAPAAVAAAPTTPDLVPDSMQSRLPDSAVPVLGLGVTAKV